MLVAFCTERGRGERERGEKERGERERERSQDSEKRWVLNQHLKTSMLPTSWILSGRFCQSFGTAFLKDLAPDLVNMGDRFGTVMIDNLKLA